MICRVCGSAEVHFVLTGNDGTRWHRCLFCGSDTSDSQYELLKYDGDYLVSHHGVDRQRLVLELTNNINGFHLFPAPRQTFLDIGCAEGTALREMEKRGWKSSGFDVIEEARAPGCVVADEFSADLFPVRFGAVLCREVIEHVPDWRRLLFECREALLTGGLLQIQTPRPWHEPHPIPYQKWHLQLFSPIVLQWELEHTGFSILHRDIWPMGQMYVCRKT